MDSIYSTPLSKATITAVFTGIVVTLLCFIRDVSFRESTHFELSTIVNVSSLIFFTNLLFLVIGFIYYGCLQIKKGEILYVALFVSLTVLFAVLASRVHRSDVPLLNSEFHQLLVSIVIIMGVGASIGIPVLFHNKKFEESVL